MAKKKLPDKFCIQSSTGLKHTDAGKRAIEFLKSVDQTCGTFNFGGQMEIYYSVDPEKKHVGFMKYPTVINVGDLDGYDLSEYLPKTSEKKSHFVSGDRVKIRPNLRRIHEQDSIYGGFNPEMEKFEGQEFIVDFYDEQDGKSYVALEGNGFAWDVRCISIVGPDKALPKERLVKIEPAYPHWNINDSPFGSELYDWLEDVQSTDRFDGHATHLYLTMVDGNVGNVDTYYDGKDPLLDVCETHTPESFMNAYAAEYIAEVESSMEETVQSTYETIQSFPHITNTTTMSTNLLAEIQTKQFFEDADNQAKINAFVEDFEEGHKILEKIIVRIDEVRTVINKDRLTMRDAIRDNDVKTIKRLLEEQEATIEYVNNFTANTIDSLGAELNVEFPFDVAKKFGKK